MTDPKVAKNDVVTLIPMANGKRLTIKITNQSQKISGLGVYNPKKLIGEQYGSSIHLGKNQYWLLPANTIDFIETMTRKAQIILPKDAAMICMNCDIKPGSVVVEGGVGSGALTMVLLSMVGSEGKVITYEKRKDFAKVGRSNIERNGLNQSWELKLQDITKGIS